MMQLYRFSPIKSQEELLNAIQYIHTACHQLCKESFGTYLPTVGNIGIFCHYEDEYTFLTQLREELTNSTQNINNKYFLLHEPITVRADGDIPEVTYTHLYIRQPDPYRSQVGDVDFYLDSVAYVKLKQSIKNNSKTPGMRLFERPDLDMIELFNPDVDALGYVYSKK